jgi:hypothetical protein
MTVCLRWSLLSLCLPASLGSLVSRFHPTAFQPLTLTFCTCCSLALRSAVLRGAAHRGCGTGVEHTLCCMHFRAVCVCAVSADPVHPYSMPCPFRVSLPPASPQSTARAAQRTGQDDTATPCIPNSQRAHTQRTRIPMPNSRGMQCTQQRKEQVLLRVSPCARVHPFCRIFSRIQS